MNPLERSLLPSLSRPYSPYVGGLHGPLPPLVRPGSSFSPLPYRLRFQTTPHLLLPPCLPFPSASASPHLSTSPQFPPSLHPPLLTTISTRTCTLGASPIQPLSEVIFSAARKHDSIPPATSTSSLFLLQHLRTA